MNKQPRAAKTRVKTLTKVADELRKHLELQPDKRQLEDLSRSLGAEHGLTPAESAQALDMAIGLY